MNLLKKVTELNNKLQMYRPLNETELKVLRDNFIYEYSYNSNAIEGNSLTLQETVLLLKDGITVGQKTIKDYLDMIGFKEAFDYIYELFQNKIKLSEMEIKNIHSLVLNADHKNKGIYRKIPVAITGSSHIPSLPYLIKSDIDQLLSNYEKWKAEKHIIEAVSLFHLEFERIHPFIDGNGRTGRLILNLELIKNNLLPIDIKFIDREKYYNAFNDYDVSSEYNANEMIDLIANYEIEELQKRLEILEMSR